MSARQRIDKLLVDRGVFESRAQAQAAIAAGLVSADGVTVRKPSDGALADATLVAAPAHPWVSRGGLKLAAALDAFGFDPAGLACLDVGASTGGFTDVLLARAARKVLAVDVGRAQLHTRLRANPAVVSLEETDVRTLEPERLGEAIGLVVIDVSFISLKLVLAAASALAAPGAMLVALAKPQFEVGRALLKKGIVRDAAAQARVCEEIAEALRALGWRVVGSMPSPIAGGDGNIEFLIGARRD